MKNVYDIRNKNGVHLCYQVASSESEAVSFAKMYGAKGATTASYVRAQ